MKTANFDTDLTDVQWELVAACFLRPSGWDDPRRLLFDAILYIVKAGCPWRLLPKSFPPWKTVHWWIQRPGVRGMGGSASSPIGSGGHQAFRRHSGIRSSAEALGGGTDVWMGDETWTIGAELRTHRVERHRLADRRPSSNHARPPRLMTQGLTLRTGSQVCESKNPLPDPGLGVAAVEVVTTGRRAGFDSPWDGCSSRVSSSPRRWLKVISFST